MKRVQDPIVLEIVKNLLNTTAEEMGLAVVRSAYSVRLKEKGDASSAIFDAEGRVIAQSQGTPLQHLSSMRPSLQSVLQDYPPGQIRDGDVYLMNDPYRGAIHSNDCIVYRPVFYNGVLSFFTAALVHVADIGGMAAGGLPANATEIYHEGLIIPPLKLQDAGEPNDTLVKILMANSRTPDKLMGDLRALQAATTLGARRIISLVEKYGYEDILRIAHETMDYSEQRMRKDIAKIPAGTYEGSYLIDDDGSDSSRRYRVHVTVEVRGSDVYVDLAGTDPQARGPINAAFSQSMSGVMMGVRCFLDPSIPMNEGCWRPLKINLPLGSLVNPKMPAPCNARVITVCAIIESIIQALSKAMPERGVAASCVNHVYTLNGTDPATGRRWIYMENDFGGVGARSIKDGPDATGPHIFGGGWANPVEAGEVEFPVRIDEYGMWRDSGGPGRFHGGLGVRRKFTVLQDAQITMRADRMRYPPVGVLGGKPGAAGQWIINEGQPSERKLPSKATEVALKAGDTFTMLTSGAGGLGDPLERDVTLVLRDVQELKVTPEAARRDYGVVIDEAGESVDVEASLALRAEMRAGNGVT